MAFIPVLNTVMLRCLYQEVGGSVAENRLYAACLGVPTMDDLNECGAAYQEWLTESFAPKLTGNWSAINVVVRAMNEAEGIEITYDTDFPVAGENSTTEFPLQVSYTTTLNTGLVGRSARGRIYGIGLPGEYVTDRKRLNDPGQSALQLVWGNLPTIFESAGHALQVVSFVEGGVAREEGRALPVLSATVRFPLANQRRRLS